MTPRPAFNILISGVGGQGVVLASYVLSQTALAQGFDVKQSEVHGMAQRGGCVTGHLRFGERVYSSLITPGTADVLLAFESVEAARYIHWLRPGGLLVYNTVHLNSSTVSAGLDTYPDDIDARIAADWPDVRALDASALAATGGHRQGGQRGHARRRGVGAAVPGRRHGGGHPPLRAAEDHRRQSRGLPPRAHGRSARMRPMLSVADDERTGVR